MVNRMSRNSNFDSPRQAKSAAYNVRLERQATLENVEGIAAGLAGDAAPKSILQDVSPISDLGDQSPFAREDEEVEEAEEEDPEQQFFNRRSRLQN